MSYYAVGLIVPAGKVASTLTSFVTRVDLSHAPAAWWAQVAAAGGDIRVKVGGVDVPIDLVGPSFNSGTHVGTLYFRSTLTTSSNVFTLECGTGAAAPAVGDPIGRNAVWQDYEVVHDFWELANRTGKTVAAVLEGAATIGGGVLDCVSSTGNAKTTGVALFTSWTAGALADRTGGASANQAVLSYSQDITGNTSRASLLWRASTSWQIWNSTDTFLSSGQTTNPVRMHHTQNTTTDRKVWTGGVLRATDTTCAQRPAGASECMFWGAEDASYAERFWGTIARGYLRDGVLSADWLAAETESWGSPATFYTIVGAAWAGGSLELSATGAASGSVPAAGSGSLSLSGAGGSTAPIVGSGSLLLTGAGGVTVTAGGSASLTLTATGEAFVFHYPAPDIQCCEPAMTRRRSA